MVTVQPSLRGANEVSDEAIPATTRRLLRSARNDGG